MCTFASRVAIVPALAKWCRGGGMNICWDLTIIVAELKAEPPC